MRWLVRLAPVLLVVASCAPEVVPSAGDPPATTIQEISPTEPPATEVPTTASLSTTASTGASEPSLGPSAPDFSLTLGDGETFVLSLEQKPVYMVFWAEW
ncbi:MAG TPA: hypothetical protein VIL12_06085 [Acidimicrobiia bacterium]